MSGGGRAYPGAEQEGRIPPDRLDAVVTGIFAACGMSADDADVLGDTPVTADLQGVRVPEYADRLLDGT